MHTFKKLLGLSVLLVTLSSCSTTVPLTATENPIGNKIGTSKTTCLFPVAPPQTTASINMLLTSSGICFNKNYSIYEAANEGGISEVATVDLKTTNYVFWTEYELVVTGK